MENNLEEELSEALTDFLKLFNVKVDFSKEAKTPSKEEKLTNYNEILEKTQKKLDELNLQNAEILKKSGMTREQLEKYGSNPQNFTPEQWKALQRVKEVTEKYKQQAKEFMGVEHLKKKTKEEKRQEIQRFGKKKRWLSV